MGEHTAQHQSFLRLQKRQQRGNIRLRKTQTMHTRIQFQVDGILSDTQALTTFQEGSQKREAIYFGFKMIFVAKRQNRNIRIHHQDRNTDARLTQTNAFIYHGNRHSVTALRLQSTAYFHRTQAISFGLYHGNHFGGSFQQRSEIAIIMHNSIQVHFQTSLMRFQRQGFSNTFKTKTTRTLNQNQFLRKGFRDIGGQKIFGT